MSYDVRVGVKVDGTDLIVEIAKPEYDQPTYNLRDMFVAATGWDYEQGKWYRVTDVIDYIRHGITELRFHMKDYKKYDSPNGWGTASSALLALESMYECIQEQTGEARGWVNEIPIEHLWIHW